MKKIVISAIGLLILSLGIYSCTKESSTNEVEKQALRKKIQIDINWDIARKKCDKDGDGKGCECGFGLCRPHIANPGGDRTSLVSLALIAPNQLKVNFPSNIDLLRENENYFTLDEDLEVPSDLCGLLGCTSLTLIAGEYVYNHIEKSVVITTTN
jgi:hypothetical protein